MTEILKLRILTGETPQVNAPATSLTAGQPAAQTTPTIISTQVITASIISQQNI
jgi:hypothetical protein